MVLTSFEEGGFADDECGEVGGDLSLTLGSLRVGVQYVDVTLYGFRVSDTQLRQPNIIL